MLLSSNVCQTSYIRTMRFKKILSIKKKSFEWFEHRSIIALAGLDKFRGTQSALLMAKRPYQLPIGHLALSNVVLSFIKHPHFLHLAKRLLNHGQVLHIANLDSISSLSDLGWFGSNKSMNSTSPFSFTRSPIFSYVKYTRCKGLYSYCGY
jgi:hypothetical protein